MQNVLPVTQRIKIQKVLKKLKFTELTEGRDRLRLVMADYFPQHPIMAVLLKCFWEMVFITENVCLAKKR